MTTQGLLRRFARDERGISMLEFSFIAPVMILMFFGIAELGQGLFAQRRSEHVSSAIGDLTAQDGSISNADMSNIFDAGAQIMAPLAATTTSLGMRVTCVTTDSNSSPKVTWSDGNGTLTANKVGNTYTMPAGMVSTSGQVFIVSESSYKYTSPVGYVLPNGLTFTNKSYFAPRLGTVARTS